MKNLVYFICILLFAACTDLSDYDEDRIQEALADSLLSVTESWDIEMDIMEDGRRVVHIKAPYAASYHEGAVTETNMKGPVIVTVTDSLGNVKTEVTSDYAHYIGRQSKFRFTGNVVVKTDENRILRTELLDWFQQERNISSSEFVTITTISDSIAGFGLEGLDDLSVYTITKVTGEFELN